MSQSQRLIERWQRELAENESLLADSSARFLWLRRAYIRVFRFLLAAYAVDRSVESSAAEFERDSPEAFSSASRMPFVDLTECLQATPAPPAADIHQTLHRIHTIREESGDVAAATKEPVVPSWLILATSQDVSIKKCKRLLQSNGQQFRQGKYGRYQTLEVPRVDFGEAEQLLNEHLKSLRRQRTSGDADFLRRVVLPILLILELSILGVCVLAWVMNDPVLWVMLVTPAWLIAYFIFLCLAPAKVTRRLKWRKKPPLNQCDHGELAS